MVRRLPHVAALVAVLLLAFPAGAAAEYRAQLAEPASGAVGGSTEVRIQVSRDANDPEIAGLQVRRADADRRHDVECVSACSSSAPVFAFVLDPRSGAPIADGPLGNGPLELEVIVRRAGGGDRPAGRVGLSLRVPGSAVGGLSATVEAGEVRVAWSRAPEPDVTAYRIERCTGACGPDGAWAAATTTTASATSFTERPTPGVHNYRVVTVRSAGGDGSIETVSSPVNAEVTSTPPPSGPGNGDDDGGDGNDDGNGGGQPTRPDEPDDEPDVSEPDDDVEPPAGSGDGSEDGSVSEPEDRDPPSASGDGDDGETDVPEDDEAPSGTDDDEAGDEAAEQTDSAESDEVVLSAPGGNGRTFVGRLADSSRVTIPVAGGLLLAAAGGLGVWRRQRGAADPDLGDD